MRRALPLLLAAALLAGCGDDGTAAADGFTLTLQAAGGEGELGALRQLVAAFEDANPDVTVDFVGVPSQGDHIAKLSTAFAGGRPPDVFLLNYRRLGPFVTRGVLAPVELGKLSRDDFYEPPLEASTYDGELACLPQNISSSLAYLNLDLFEQAGVPLPEPDWTWDDLEAAAQRFAAQGIEGFGLDPMVRNVAPFVWTAGGEVVDDTADPTRMTFETPEAERALTSLEGLQQYGVDATDRAATETVERFARGDLAVFVDSRRSVPAFRASEGLRFDVRPLPRADAARPARRCSPRTPTA
jgi:multiple sugar transport system substrate-binding protein